MSAAFGDARLPLRFWSKVLPVEEGCWIWIGAISGTGYGSFGVRTGRGQSAHRHAFLTLVGPVDPDLDLDHLCRNRACVNPSHLEPVTRLENVRRGDGGKHQAAKTHCPKGHSYSGENLIVHKDGGRSCRECTNAANRFYRMKHSKLRRIGKKRIAELNAALESA